MARTWQLFTVLLLAVVVLSCQARRQAQRPFPQEGVLGEIKSFEKSLGFEETKNFAKRSAKLEAHYRCYFTGKFELPDSYEDLGVEDGTRDGCDVDESKYDLFFYPIEAVGSGKTPVTESLSQASLDRLLVVVPHEDFHSQKPVRKLPSTMSEAASTLVGFLTAGEFARNKFGLDSEEYQRLSREAELFLKKAKIVNRYHSRLRELYESVRNNQTSRADGLETKKKIFAELEAECGAIRPSAKSFNKCPSVSNNAALAFDRSYTKHYPLMYELFLAQGRNLRKTIQTLTDFTREKDVSESEAERYLAQLVEAAR